MRSLTPRIAAIQAGVVGAFAVLLAAGAFTIPLAADFTDHQAVANTVGGGGRWAVGHLVSAAAFGLGLLSLVVLAGWARAREPARLVPAMLPLAALGAGLLAAGLGADGLGPLIFERAGSDARDFFDASGAWVSGTFAVGVIAFSIAAIAIVGAAAAAGLARGAWRIVVVIGAAAPLANAVPSGYALWLVAVLTLLGYGYLALRLWRDP